MSSQENKKILGSRNELRLTKSWYILNLDDRNLYITLCTLCTFENLNNKSKTNYRWKSPQKYDLWYQMLKTFLQETNLISVQVNLPADHLKCIHPEF